MSPVLSVKNLTVRFDTEEGPITVVEDASLELARGEVLGIVGESGSGKSVTAKSIMQLNGDNAEYDSASRIELSTDAGSIDILSLRNEREKRLVRGDKVSMIFQEPMASFAPAITIGKQMVEQLRVHRGMTKAEAKEVSIAALKAVGISDAETRFGQYAFELSGGMRQRAMIATALSTRPSLLIADEPTTALDVTIQAQVLDIMRGLVRDIGMSVIFITHDLGVIAQMADRVAVMYLGRIIEQGPVEEVIGNPSHPYTKGLLRALPDLEDLSRPLQPVPGDIPSPLERPEGCVFHTRCAHKIAGRCDVAVPAANVVSPNHSVNCVLAETEAAETQAEVAQ